MWNKTKYRKREKVVNMLYDYMCGERERVSIDKERKWKRQTSGRGNKSPYII